MCKISLGLVGAIFGCWIGARFWRQVKNRASLFRGNIKMHVIYRRANKGTTSINKWCSKAAVKNNDEDSRIAA
jgi:hypothetical protein